MADFKDVEAVRPALRTLCLDRSSRINGRNADSANRWRPFTVREPDTQMLFTDEGAWEFIADCLRDGCPVECMPPTPAFPDFAYYMVKAVRGDKKIYMKIAIRPPVRIIVGVSFHYEDKR